MSSATLRPALAPVFALAAYPLRVLAVVAWAAVALAIAPWATDAFVGWSGSGLALAALWPFARAWRRGLDPGDALWCFLLYFVLAMLLRGMGVLTFVDSPYLRGLGDPRSPSFRLLAGWVFFYSTLGLVALNAAYHAPSARRWAERCLRRRPLLSAPWRDSRIVPVGVGMLAIGGIGLLLRLHSVGGFANAAMNPMDANTVGAVGRYWQIALTEFAVAGFHVLVIGCMLRGGRHLMLLWLGLGLALSVPLFLASSSKALLIRVLFTPMIFRHFLLKPLRMRHVVGFFAGFSLLFPLFYAYRALGAAGLGETAQYLQTTEAPLLKVYSRAYDADSFMRVLHATQQGLVPLQWGHSLSDLFIFFIPRAVWAAKPEAFGLEFARLYMPDVQWGAITYVSPSLAGELFLNFHVAGVVAGFLLLGWAMSAAFTLARRGGAGAVFLYGYFFLAAVHLVEGSIAAQIEFFLTSTLPVLIALSLLRAGRAPRAPLGSPA
jgi:hypothetical protein